jgi:hypothetical protein
MPKIEIDENEYAELKRVSDVARVIGNHPKAREMLQQAVAIAAPEQAGPEIRIRQEVTEKLSGIEKMLADDREERRKEKEERAADNMKRSTDRQWRAGQAKLRDAGYNEEGIAAVEKLMEERTLVDHEAGAALFERLNPPAQPVVSGGSRWNFFDLPKDDISLDTLLKGNDEAFLNQSIPAVLKDVRGG